VSTRNRKLSEDQEWVLLWLVERQKEGYVSRGNWGVPWRGEPGLSASDRASMSRTLRRLEGRGFVLRQNRTGGCPITRDRREGPESPHNRTTHVQITEAGLTLAERLTKETSFFVNR
jgi:hypothetical protein